MAIQVQLKVDTSELRRALRRLADVEAKRAMASALNRTSFELLDALKAEVSSLGFDFAGPATQSFLSGKGSFRFDGAKPDRLTATIFPSPKTEEILAKHATGAMRTAASDVLRLGDQIAVPVEVPVSARGRVAARYLPSRAVRRKRRQQGVKVFRAGRAILERAGASVRVLYALIPRFQLRPRFDFEGVAKRTGERVFVEKARQEFQRAIERARVR